MTRNVLLGRLALPALLSAVIQTGCASSIAHPPPVQHIVLFQLNDPAEARALCGDSFQLMQGPVQSLIAGPAIRPPDAADATERIDAGITAMFNSVEDYRTFMAHPATNAFMSRWSARATLVRTATYGPTCEPEPEEAPAR